MSNDWKEAKRKVEEFQEMMEELGLDFPSPWPPPKNKQPEWEIPEYARKEGSGGTYRRAD